MTIGEKIARRRKELNLTQEQLADKLGYKSKSTINKIELGINDLTQTKVEKFAKALNVSVAYLMGWEEETNSYDSGDKKMFDDLQFFSERDEKIRIEEFLELTKDFSQSEKLELAQKLIALAAKQE